MRQSSPSRSRGRQGLDRGLRADGHERRACGRRRARGGACRRGRRSPGRRPRGESGMRFTGSRCLVVGVVVVLRVGDGFHAAAAYRACGAVRHPAPAVLGSSPCPPTTMDAPGRRPCWPRVPCRSGVRGPARSTLDEVARLLQREAERREDARFVGCRSRSSSTRIRRRLGRRSARMLEASTRRPLRMHVRARDSRGHDRAASRRLGRAPGDRAPADRARGADVNEKRWGRPHSGRAGGALGPRRS